MGIFESSDSNTFKCGSYIHKSCWGMCTFSRTGSIVLYLLKATKSTLKVLTNKFFIALHKPKYKEAEIQTAVQFLATTLGVLNSASDITKQGRDPI